MKTPLVDKTEADAIVTPGRRLFSPRARQYASVTWWFLAGIMGYILLASPVSTRGQSGPPGIISGGTVPDGLAAIYASIASSEYEINWQPEFGAYMTPNRANNLRFLFLNDGFSVTRREPKHGDLAWSATFRLDRYGRAGVAPGRIRGISWSSSNNTAQARSEGLVIEYSNDLAGMRQSFLITQRPPGKGPLSLDFVLGHELVDMLVDSSAGSLYLVGGSSGTDVVMSYSDLNVFDSNQKRLTAEMIKVDNDHFAIVVDDRDAVYPVLVDPLAGYQNGGSENSPAPGSQFGFSVACVINYDGAPDGELLVGAPYFDPGGHAQAGEVFLYDTLRGLLPASPTWSWAGNQTGEHVGWSVSDGGLDNFNGAHYGFHNILVGAPGYNSQNGAAFAFYPNYGGVLPSSPSWTVTGSSGSSVGSAVAWAHDVNGDGYDDILVGAPKYTTYQGTTGAGQVMLYLGTSTGFKTSPAWGATGTYANGNLGTSIVEGDVNGDGRPDVVIGSPGANGEAGGYVYVYLNGGTVYHSTPDAMLSSGLQGPQQFGAAVASGASQSGAPYDDLVVGAPYSNAGGMTANGKAYLYRGGTSGINTTPVWSDYGAQNGAHFGTSVALGDMNADGYADVFVGAPDNSSIGASDNGRAVFYLTSSSTHLPVLNTLNDGLCSNLRLGASVAYGSALVNGNANMIAGGPGADGGSCVNVQVWYYHP